MGNNADKKDYQGYLKSLNTQKQFEDDEPEKLEKSEGKYFSGYGAS